MSNESFTYNGSQGWWKSNGYYSNKITGKVVSGDFNGDGKEDIAAFYDNGIINGKPSTSLHTWISTGSSFQYKDSKGWWNSEGYDCNRIADKVISGDFNGDGKDDIAAFYKVDDNTTNLHVWISTGSSFQYQYSQGWWNSKGYNSDKISSRIVAGDFNGDGKDDIAAFYKVGDCNTSLHTWISTGSSFQYQYSQGWWNSNGYNSDQISNKVVAGDFNGDGKDDIAAFYKADAYDTRLHTWMSTGSSFQYKDSQGWWNSKGYNSDQISNRVVAGDFNGDGKDDIAAFYKADAYDTRLNTWISTGASFGYKDSQGWWNSKGYNSDQISNRVVAGDFDGDDSCDVAAFYDNSGNDTSLHVWKSNAIKSIGGSNSMTFSKVMVMKSTAYSGDAITAKGTKPKRNPNGYSTIAVDPRVIPIGSRVYVEGYGYAIAEDTGGAIKGNIIDVFMNSKAECISWGRRNVKVYIIN
ncbi:FG-GAP-like repeat-containing protein [Clostridium sporogenes]|nr:FG-GAP-like repeat-containing protein [Clostridium sporogenes]